MTQRRALAAVVIGSGLMGLASQPATAQSPAWAPVAETQNVSAVATDGTQAFWSTLVAGELGVKYGTVGPGQDLVSGVGWFNLSPAGSSSELVYPRCQDGRVMFALNSGVRGTRFPPRCGIQAFGLAGATKRRISDVPAGRSDVYAAGAGARVFIVRLPLKAGKVAGRPSILVNEDGRTRPLRVRGNRVDRVFGSQDTFWTPAGLDASTRFLAVTRVRDDRGGRRHSQIVVLDLRSGKLRRIAKASRSTFSQPQRGAIDRYNDLSGPSISGDLIYYTRWGRRPAVVSYRMTSRAHRDIGLEGVAEQPVAVAAANGRLVVATARPDNDFAPCGGDQYGPAPISACQIYTRDAG